MLFSERVVGILRVPVSRRHNENNSISWDISTHSQRLGIY